MDTALVGPISNVEVQGTQYRKDWNGDWYYISYGGMYHIGPVLSEFTHTFYTEYHAKRFLEDQGWTCDDGVLRSHKAHKDISPYEWKAVAYLYDEWNYEYAPS